MYEKYKNIIWFLRGSQRKNLFLNLPDAEFMPNKLRKKLPMKISLREMSRHLKNLKEKGFIKCLNEKDPYNRIYIITGKGKNVKKELRNFEK